MSFLQKTVGIPHFGTGAKSRSGNEAQSRCPVQAVRIAFFLPPRRALVGADVDYGGVVRQRTKRFRPL